MWFAYKESYTITIIQVSAVQMHSTMVDWSLMDGAQARLMAWPELSMLLIPIPSKSVPSLSTAHYHLHVLVGFKASDYLWPGINYSSFIACLYMVMTMSARVPCLIFDRLLTMSFVKFTCICMLAQTVNILKCRIVSCTMSHRDQIISLKFFLYYYLSVAFVVISFRCQILCYW